MSGMLAHIHIADVDFDVSLRVLISSRPVKGDLFYLSDSDLDVLSRRIVELREKGTGEGGGASDKGHDGGVSLYEYCFISNIAWLKDEQSGCYELHVELSDVVPSD